MASKARYPGPAEALTAYERLISGNPHGVAVPDALLKNPDELGTWFDRSHDWAGTIKPKSTTRR